MTLWKKQNYGDCEKSMVGSIWEGKRDEHVEHRIFKDNENTLYDTIMRDTCHYTFVHIN